MEKTAKNAHIHGTNTRPRNIHWKMGSMMNFNIEPSFLEPDFILL